MIVILSRGECPMTMLSPVVYNIQWQRHRIEQSPVVICPVTYRRMMDNNNYTARRRLVRGEIPDDDDMK